MDYTDARDNSCKYEAIVECSSKSQCASCGWNPAVKRARVQQFLNERKHDLKVKPRYCPLQGHPAFSQKCSLDMVLRCYSSKCVKNADGLCKTFAEAISFWQGVEASIIGAATEKVETKYEQPQ